MVEDQDAVRAVTVRILRRNGYVVLEAAVRGRRHRHRRRPTTSISS